MSVVREPPRCAAECVDEMEGDFAVSGDNEVGVACACARVAATTSVV